MLDIVFSPSFFDTLIFMFARPLFFFFLDGRPPCPEVCPDWELAVGGSNEVPESDGEEAGFPFHRIRSWPCGAVLPFNRLSSPLCGPALPLARSILDLVRLLSFSVG